MHAPSGNAMQAHIRAISRKRPTNIRDTILLQRRVIPTQNKGPLIMPSGGRVRRGAVLGLRLAAQGGDSLAQRWMGHKQTAQPVADTAGNTERRHLVRQGLRMCAGQALQGGDHLFPPRQARPAGIGAELSSPAEPHHDGAGEDAQHQFGDDGGDPERRAVAALGLEHHTVHQMTDRDRKITKVFTTP